MYIERHLQHTRIHIKFCYLIAKTLHSLSDTHIQPPQNTAHAFECRALFSIRGTSLLTFKDECLLLYIIEKEGNILFRIVYMRI